MAYDADVIVVGAGLAGLAATAELADAGRRVILLDQEPEQSLGGQAYWSFGGLFFVDSPEQRRMRITRQPRAGLAGLAGHRRLRPPRGPLAAPLGRGVRRLRRRREAGLAACAGRADLPCRRLGRARRLRRDRARQLGAALPHHLGHRARAGRALRAAGARRRRARPGRAALPAPRHRAVPHGGRRRHRERRGAGSPATRRAALPAAAEVVGAFELRAQAVIVTSGGIGGNHELVRANWPERLGTPPASLLSGVPAHVDGLMLGITESAGGRIINRDRMWHYTEGIENWNPIWARHGIRILPGPSSLWLDATGKRLPVPLFPGLRHPRHPRPHHAHRARLHLVRAQPEDHREGVRALRLRAESGPHRQAPCGTCSAGGAAGRRARCGPSWSTARTSWSSAIWPLWCGG